MNARHEAGYEPRDVHGRAVTLIVLGLLLGAGFISLCTLGFEHLLFRHRTAVSLTDTSRALPLPRTPRLQIDPEADLAAFRQREQQQLDTYGWADGRHHAAHIPIARAMARYVAQGGTR